MSDCDCVSSLTENLTSANVAISDLYSDKKENVEGDSLSDEDVTPAKRPDNCPCVKRDAKCHNSRYEAAAPTYPAQRLMIEN